MIKILRLLRSTKLALALIAVLAFYAAFAGGRGAFRSFLFLVPLGLFTLNLLLCTVHRISSEASGRRSWKPGPDLVHLALLLFIAAGMVSLFGRWEGQVMLSPGEAVSLNESSLILLEDFRVERYDDGTPRAWVSQVSLVEAEDGAVTDRREIRVNHPARFGAFRIYQASWHQEGDLLFSGLLAVRDPSVPIVLLALALMVTGLGMIYIPAILKLLERS